ETEVERESLPRPVLAPEVQDLGEETLYGEDTLTAEPRLAWRDEWQASLRNATPWRAVVLGPPGQGQSLLPEATARELALQATRDLTGQDLRVEEVPLPLVVSLPALVQRGIPAAEGPEEALRRGLAEALQAMGCPGEIARHLATHVHEERSWLFLD